MAGNTYIMLAEVGVGAFTIVTAALHGSILNVFEGFQSNFGLLLLFLWLATFLSLMIDLAAWKKEKRRLHSVLQFFNVAILIFVTGCCVFYTISP
jgi:hypothetical protein